MARKNRDLIILLGFVFLITLPFINKAFHIDDVAWISVAQAVLNRPSQPLHGQASLNNEDIHIFQKLGKPPRTFDRLSHPLLFPYFLALVIFLGQGIREWSLHLALILFTGLAALAVYRLGERFTKYPLVTALFVMATPMFMISAHSVMNDVTMLAFYLLAILTYIRGIDRGARRGLILSGLLIALAIFTRYIALALIPLLATYALLKERKLSRSAVLPFAIALLLWGLWEVQNIIHYGGVHLLASSKFASTFYEGHSFTARIVVLNALANLASLGGAAVVPLALLWVFLARRRKMIGVALLIAAALFGLAKLRFVRETPLFADLVPASDTHLLLFLFFFMTGLVTVYHVLAVGLKSLAALWPPGDTPRTEPSADTLFLVLWFGGMLVSATLLLPFGAARYMLPLLVPLVILFIRQMDDLGGGRRPVRSLLIFAGIGLTLATGFALAYTDYKHAGIYRKFARSLKDMYRDGNRQIWYLGGDWGLRYYMDRENFAYLWTRDSSPKKGDLVIQARQATLYDMPEALKSRCKRLETLSFYSHNPIKVLNSTAGAGFYSNFIGLLPYSFSLAPVEDFFVFAIKAPSFFLEHLAEAVKEVSTPGAVTVDWLTLKGDTRLTLLEHPPARITYRLTVPEDTFLSFGVALHPDVWKPEYGDGVTFEVAVRHGDKEQTLFSKYIDPKNRPDDRQWYDARLDLSEYGGREILLSLITLPGPADDSRYDTGGWSGLELDSNPPPAH